MSSWKVEIKTPGDKDWVSNALRFASMDEAKQYSVDLDWRWTISMTGSRKDTKACSCSA